MFEKGLTEEEVVSRLAKFGPNEIPADAKKSILSSISSVVREPMITLLIFAGIISFILAERLDGFLLITTVFIIVGISLFQERRTEEAVNALRTLAAPLALVIRSGARVRISANRVVPGDLVQLLEGDRIPADAELVESKFLLIDESLLTGESLPVAKNIADMVFTGTLVVRGHGLARVKTTGKETELGKIGSSLSTIVEPKTQLQKNVTRLVRAIGFAALITVSFVIAVYGTTRGNWLEGALAGIAVA
ncbi:MAG: HAD-IC family P-type ATPase, partial [Actinomycetota bacterium]